MPPWVNEGIAELFERAVVLDDGILLGDVDRGSLRLLRDAAQGNRLIPFDRMFKMDSDDWQDHVTAGRGALNYAQAWAVVHFLIYGEGGRFVPTFERFLVLMNRGLSSQAAFQQAFGMHHLGPFADRWLAYLWTLEATDLAGTITRLEYLAAGLLDLAEAGNEPETMAALKTALKENEFRYETSRFGIKGRLSFDNDAVFKPAGEAGDRGAATFVLSENRPPRGRSTARPKPGADGPVLPARAVFTRGLAPLDLGVIWGIDRRSGERSWQLITDRSHPEVRRR